jgi:predicted Zn-dependent protease
MSMTVNHDEAMKGDPLSRRDFLRMTTLLGAGFVLGCAIDPVTGKQTLMLVSEDQEIEIDKRNSPHQFSADNGVVQDKALNDYVSQVGREMTAKTHRPQMPYSFRVVNATYVNAYAFPGGSIACTRGIMLAMDNEAELAGLLGHELGHVNARHTAEQMSKGQLTQAVVGGLSVLAGTQGAVYGQMASQLGMIGAGALLASYSRDNEREADRLGMEYMVKSGYNPEGMVGLMEVLRGMSKRNPSAIELMFATHPMSEERYQTAKQAAGTGYQSARNLPLYKERYMDKTAKLRSQKPAIDELQKGQTEMMRKQMGNAQAHFQQGLKLAPNDYTALVMMSTSLILQERYAEGIRYAEQAQQVYPQEAKAYHLSGFAKLQNRDFDGANQEFATYDQILPGNSNTAFYRGYALEGMERREQAAQQYYRYLQSVRSGDKAKYAYSRLQEWGYTKAQ